LTINQSTKSRISQAVEALTRLNIPATRQAIQCLSGASRSSVKRYAGNLKPEPCSPQHIIDTSICQGERGSYLSSPDVSGVSCSALMGLAGDSLFDALGLLVGCVIRSEGGLVDTVHADRVSVFGRHFAEMVCRVSSSDGNKKSVRRDVSYLDYLSREPDFYKYFQKHDGYEVGVRSLNYSVKPYGLSIWNTALKMLSELSHDEVEADYDFTFPMDRLPLIRASDVKTLLSSCAGASGGHLLIDGRAKYSDLDVDSCSRVYGTATEISNDTRLQAGLIGYDVSACYPVIAMARCLSSTKMDEHRKFTANPRRYREAISSAEGVSYKKAKIAVTKVMFGGAADYVSIIPIAEEIKLISRSVLSMAMLADDGRYDRAVDMSKKEGDTTVLFHLLAMDEKRIRDAMSTCFDKRPLEVHDAVYSYEDLPVEMLEKAVKEQTGFAVKITKEVK